MAILAHRSDLPASEDRPVLHLDGPSLTAALRTLVAASEPLGGVEKYVGAVKLKAALFQGLLGGGKAESLDEDDFLQLCAFVATCRRRIAEPLKELGFRQFRMRIAELLDGAGDTATADARIGAFVRAFPDGKRYRWVRDLAAEVLHNVLPEHYPLMTRWVWDAKANTGVLREIWHGPNVDHMIIDAPDTHDAFIVLREELSQFLADNGVFRDMLFYVDLLKAQIYADYINAQGGTYLRTDFASEGDPLEHSRRFLGLDGIDPETGRSRVKNIDGSPRVIDEQKWIS
jgi:hypothetical protein